jgi:hypothetical protein
VSTSTSVSVLVAIIIVAVIALSKLRKTFRGWKVKRKPIFVITILYLGLTCFFAVSSFFIGIPFLYLIVYLTVFIISQFVSYHYADRSLSFWKTLSKGGLLIHVVYIVSVVLRFAISLAYIGSQSFQYRIEASAQLDGKSDVVTFAIIMVDIFMIFGLGLLVGLNRRLLKRFHLISQGKEIIEEKNNSAPLWMIV